MSDFWINIVSWLIAWSVPWGIFLIFFYKANITQITHPAWTASYFLFFSIITFIYFKEYLIQVPHEFSFTPFAIFILLFLSNIISYLFIPRYIKEPRNYFKKYPEREWLEIKFGVLVSRFIELLSQQVLIVLLSVFLQQAGFSMIQIMASFALIFGAAHAPLILIQHGGWPSYYFVIFSILSAIVFPFLILNVEYGFIYAYLIHLTFYEITSIAFVIVHRKK